MGLVTFSTSGLREQDRLDLWECHNAEALIGLRCRTLGETVLEASETTVEAGRLRLARVLGSSHIVERDAKLIAGQPTDSIALYFSLVGESFFYRDHGMAQLQPGRLLVCDADRPFLRGFSNGLEELVLRVPRDLFADVTGRRDVSEPVVLDFATAGNPLAHALARQVGEATRAVGAEEVDEAGLMELLGSLLGPASADFSAAHRAAARVYIGQHLAEPGLSATEIASAIGISPRHLSRVFAEGETTVPQYVLARRLEAAQRLLRSPESAALTIAAVAQRCGFASAAHFSSAFSKRFGERATDYRRRLARRRNLTG